MNTNSFQRRHIGPNKNEQKQKIENLETKMKKTELEKAEISAKE